MTTASSDQLPAGIEMPEAYTHSLSSQIWFFSGVQAGLEGRASQNERELAQSIGASVEKAYQAGLSAGQAKRAELEAPAHHILVPAQHSGTLQEKIWFMKGVDAGLAGQAFEQPASLGGRSAAELLQAYRTGYHMGKRSVG